MPYQCRLVDFDKETDDIGDMFFVPEERIFKKAEDNGITRYFCFGYELSEEYVTQRMSQRRPLMVVLPCRDQPRGMWFCIDSACTDQPEGQRHGWAVSGDPPNITVSPSIDAGALFHGFLTNGAVTFANQDVVLVHCGGKVYEMRAR